MKKIISLVLLLSVMCSGFVFAGWVSGYFKANGTYVAGYYKSDANATVKDNYSYKGNVNPYTGITGTNKYKKSPSSEYYDLYDSE